MKPAHTVNIFISPPRQYLGRHIDDRKRVQENSLDQYISSVRGKSRTRFDDVMAAREMAAIKEMFV